MLSAMAVYPDEGGMAEMLCQHVASRDESQAYASLVRQQQGQPQTRQRRTGRHTYKKLK